ncbi:MAG: oligosaccharide flippase family protein [Clostridia bacterium]|nr:oligosaccharide flippase family protein [Clostridia bacterium]
MKKSLSTPAIAAGLLTLMSFALRGMGMLFRVYLTDVMGAAGIGLYQLIMSVYSVFATFATSGFTVAVSRLAAERISEDGNRKGSVRVLVASSALALCVGGGASAVLYGGAGYMAQHFIGEASAAPSLRILALSMPFMALSACLKGYFIAVGQIYKPTAASLFEQSAKIVITVLVFSRISGDSASAAALCGGALAGITAGECFSFIFLFVLYVFFSGDKGSGRVKEGLLSSVKGVAGVTMPIAASAYVTNLLHGVESVLLPDRFARHGGSREAALAEFGTVRGMSIPLLFFPYAFLGALLSIQVPAVSQLGARGDLQGRNRLIGRIMESTMCFSVVCGGFFFLFAKELSLGVYGNTDCVRSLRLLALVTPFMYMETMSDGLLKTVGEQKRTLVYSIINSVFRIVGVLFYIPYSGSMGYLWLLMASNTLSFLLCYGRLRRLCGFRIGASSVIRCVLQCIFCLGGAFIVSKTGFLNSYALRAGSIALATALLYLWADRVGART